MPAPDATAANAPHLPTSQPRVVAWLGYGGLLPFVALAAASVFDPERLAWWSAALISYGAVILSFVGALHWGFAMGLRAISATQRNTLYVWSVVPSLMAWPAMLLGGTLGSVLLIAGFGLHYAHDLRLARTAEIPPWYLPLRLRLTATACACLAVGAISSVVTHG